MRPLGSLRSWMFDGTLTGALLPPTAVLVLGGVAWLELGVRPFTLLSWMTCASAIGAGLCLMMAPLAWLFARWTWRAPVAAFSLGPVLGAIGAFASWTLIFRVMQGREERLNGVTLLLLLGFGPFAVGPPWVAYLAVRSRDRAGTPVVAAAIVWVGVVTAFFPLLAWLRSILGLR